MMDIIGFLLKTMIAAIVFAVLLLGLGEPRSLNGKPKVLGCRYVTESGEVYDTRGRLILYEDGYGEIDVLVPHGWMSIPVSGKQVADVYGDVCVYFKRPVTMKNKRRCITLEKTENFPVPDRITESCGDRRILALLATDCPPMIIRQHKPSSGY